MLLKKLKSYIENIPYPVGHLLAMVPFQWRLGKKYGEFSNLAGESESWDSEQHEKYKISQFRNIFQYAMKNLPFYQRLYKKHGIENLQINTVADISNVPIITKADIRDYLFEFSGAYKLNTGGTTGTPFAFYVDKNAWAREWAHMHRIWSFLGYDYRDLNLALRGRNIGERPFVYNPVHNEYLINTYRNLNSFADDFLKLSRAHRYYYVHGYPSTVYNFIIEAEKTYPLEIVQEILGKIHGVLLHSEYPYDYMKKKFQQYNLPCISWYGHSEMCILAYDKDFNNHYVPMTTYGLAEVIDHKLLGTSFHNFDMPLIRYDTGDIVDELTTTEHGLCLSFAVTCGRSGDYIVDNSGKNIPLTSLIFGRHHKAFDYVEHIQIHQDSPGTATVYLITSKALPEDLSSLFDLSCVNMTFSFEVKKAPVLTSAGKLRLKI